MSVPDIMFFGDEEEMPRPPHQVEITDVQVRPLPDGRRVVVQVTLTPFVEYPSFDVTILRPDGAVERTLSVISAMERTNTLTMHLSQSERAPEYVARVELMRDGAVLQARDVRFAAPTRPDAVDGTLNSPP
jgi:hypothetical protein